MVEEELPLKQGLKLGWYCEEKRVVIVEEELPLKQGLKLVPIDKELYILERWRGTSIKTRIETWLYQLPTFSLCLVEEELPLKQGLKPLRDLYYIIKVIVEEELPLKQGLKQDMALRKGLACEVEEELPLKQGLKRKNDWKVRRYSK